MAKRSKNSNQEGNLPPGDPGSQVLGLHQLLFLLLPGLEANGFTLTPDRYLRLLRVVEALPPDFPLVRCRHLLCAILASDPEQQRIFHALFDQILAAMRPEETPAPTPTSEPAPVQASSKAKPIQPPSEPEADRYNPRKTPEPSQARRPLVVDLDECTEPPFSWNIVPDKEDVPIETGPQFGRTLVQLRRRETAEHLLPDLPASIRATIGEGGVPAFRYRRPTRPVEYLLLVERYALDDHRAALFDHFYRTLRQNDVLMERFFYQGDLRLCRNERYPAGLNLQQLRYRYPDARLVVMGGGYRLLSPKTGEPADWLRPLYGWRRRILLTPISRLQWGQRERALEGLFTLLPASLQSLHYLSDAPDEVLHGGYDALPEYVRRIAEVEPLALETPYLTRLFFHFSPEQLCWIAACAVYPALHFELTLRLGRLLSESLGRNLLKASNLLALARLPWFTEGRMPPEARTELLEWLEYSFPLQYRQVLDYLHDLMENNPPPENSVAWAEHRINLALMELARNPQPDPETLAQLRAVIKRLDRPQRRGDFVLPNHWEALLKKIGFEEERGPFNYPIPPMALIPAGTFEMGDVMGDKEYDREQPVHTVTLDAFYLGKYAVTFEEYDAFCVAAKREKPKDAGWGRGKRPVIHVSWDDAAAYCNWLSTQHGFQPVYTISGSTVTANWQANGYRLPTEAEWEYAAREGGKKVRFGNGKDIADPSQINFDASASYKKGYSVVGEYRQKTVPVGSLNSPNALGLHDMSGNVYEWCWDWYGDYPSAAQTNPKGPSTGSYRVLRGGSWGSLPQLCRVAYRNFYVPGIRRSFIGFRLARTF